MRVAIPFERGIRFTADDFEYVSEKPAESQSPSSGASGSRGESRSRAPWYAGRLAIPFERGIRFTGVSRAVETSSVATTLAIPFERGIRFTALSALRVLRGEFQTRNPLRAGHPVHGWARKEPTIRRPEVAIPFERGIRFTAAAGGAATATQPNGRNPLRAGHPVHGTCQMPGVGYKLVKSQSPSSGASGSRLEGRLPAEHAAQPSVAIPFERGIRFTD